MKEEDNIQNWNEFIKEVEIVFSNKSKIADAECKIETFCILTRKETYHELHDRV